MWNYLNVKCLLYLFLYDFYLFVKIKTVYSALIVENFRPIAEIWELALKSMGFEVVDIIENSDDFTKGFTLLYLEQ